MKVHVRVFAKLLFIKARGKRQEAGVQEAGVQEAVKRSLQSSVCSLQ